MRLVLQYWACDRTYLPLYTILERLLHFAGSVTALGTPATTLLLGFTSDDLCNSPSIAESLLGIYDSPRESPLAHEEQHEWAKGQDAALALGARSLSPLPSAGISPAKPNSHVHPEDTADGGMATSAATAAAASPRLPPPAGAPTARSRDSNDMLQEQLHTEFMTQCFTPGEGSAWVPSSWYASVPAQTGAHLLMGAGQAAAPQVAEGFHQQQIQLPGGIHRTTDQGLCDYTGPDSRALVGSSALPAPINPYYQQQQHALDYAKHHRQLQLQHNDQLLEPYPGSHLAYGQAYPLAQLAATSPWTCALGQAPAAERPPAGAASLYPPTPAGLASGPLPYAQGTPVPSFAELPAVPTTAGWPSVQRHVTTAAPQLHLTFHRTRSSPAATGPPILAPLAPAQVSSLADLAWGRGFPGPVVAPYGAAPEAAPTPPYPYHPRHEEELSGPLTPRRTAAANPCHHSSLGAAARPAASAPWPAGPLPLSPTAHVAYAKHSLATDSPLIAAAALLLPPPVPSHPHASLQAAAAATRTQELVMNAVAGAQQARRASTPDSARKGELLLLSSMRLLGLGTPAGDGCGAAGSTSRSFWAWCAAGYGAAQGAQLPAPGGGSGAGGVWPLPADQAAALRANLPSTYLNTPAPELRERFMQAGRGHGTHGSSAAAAAASGIGGGDVGGAGGGGAVKKALVWLGPFRLGILGPDGRLRDSPEPCYLKRQGTRGLVACALQQDTEYYLLSFFYYTHCLQHHDVDNNKCTSGKKRPRMTEEGAAAAGTNEGAAAPVKAAELTVGLDGNPAAEQLEEREQVSRQQLPPPQQQQQLQQHVTHAVHLVALARKVGPAPDGVKAGKVNSKRCRDKSAAYRCCAPVRQLASGGGVGQLPRGDTVAGVQHTGAQQGAEQFEFEVLPDWPAL